jgi:hypothetical protein
MRFAGMPEQTAREKMIDLVVRKARHAQGYHASARLHGKTIDEWMNPDHMDPGNFLDVLARSRHIRPGNSADSPFLRQLVAFRGPMFRIFPPHELRVIADWIDSLAGENSRDAAPFREEGRAIASLAPVPAPVPVWSGRLSLRPLERAKDPDTESMRRYAQKPLGDIYHYLLNVEDYPDVRPFARQFATLWLAKAGRGLHKGNLPIPFEPYRHQALDAWLDAQSSRQIDSYQHSDGPPAQTKEDLIDSTIQLAPMIFIDGAWIQHASNASSSHTRIGSKLFHIYIDEVGNGDVEMNHPNVFRELLAQMGVDLPEFGTIEFSRFRRFRPEAFRVPVFWLSISQFPKSFQAETLGLNLAMELSGVGGSYRSGIDTLRYYGFDPCFVELHNNIDNVSTGHTRLAIDAIKCYLDEVHACGGTKLVQQCWQRVWTGYRALAPRDVRVARPWSLVLPFWKH